MGANNLDTDSIASAFLLHEGPVIETFRHDRGSKSKNTVLYSRSLLDTAMRCSLSGPVKIVSESNETDDLHESPRTGTGATLANARRRTRRYGAEQGAAARLETFVDQIEVLQSPRIR